jgi:hypothetical protein
MLQGPRACHGCIKMERGAHQFSPWASKADLTARRGRLLWWSGGGGSFHGQEAWNWEKHYGMQQSVTGHDGVVCGAFYRVVVVRRGGREEETTSRWGWSLTWWFWRWNGKRGGGVASIRWGTWRSWGSTSVLLLGLDGGWLTKRRHAGSGGGTGHTEEGDDGEIGLCGLRHSARPRGLLGQNSWNKGDTRRTEQRNWAKSQEGCRNCSLD